MKENNYMEAFAEGISFIRRWWTDKKEDWVGALDEFYPALGLANFTNWQLEEVFNENPPNKNLCSTANTSELLH